MALTPGAEGLSGDHKRLQQRADSFAIGTGTRDSKDRDDIEAFDETIESVVKGAKVAEQQDEDAEEKSRELKEYQDSSLLEEAERRGSRPTSPNLLGLMVLPGVSSPNMAIGETPRSESKGRSGKVSGVEKPEAPTLSPELLNQLKAAGLEDPVVTLDDPRLTKAADRLNQDYTLSLRDSDRVYVWSKSGCHQILTIGLHDTRVESAAGTTVETLIRQGKVDQKQIRSRPGPQSFEELT